MKLVEMETGWIPQGMHGSLPYNSNQNIASVVQNGINTLLLQRFRITPQEIRYITESKSDGSLQVTFEVIG